MHLFNTVIYNDTTMDTPSSSTLTKINAKKCTSTISEYIWNNATLKFLVFNPFMVAVVILLVIYLIDIAHGKKFGDIGKTSVIQHMLITYAVIASGFVINNMLVKHYYRIKKCKDEEKKDIEEVEKDVEEAVSGANELYSTYI